MRIALVSPPFGMTGGPEVVVQNLATALSQLGVSVTLFAPGDWKTSVPHIPTIPQSLWNMDSFPTQSDKIRRNYIYASQTTVLKYQDNFDLIHLHSQGVAYPIGAAAKIPCLVTLHNKIYPEVFDQLQEANISTIALTHSQAGDFPVTAIIGNGMPLKNITPSFVPGKYLLAVGRLTEQKGIPNAIAVAKKSGVPLVIIGRVGISDDRKRYFAEHIKPHVDGKLITLIEFVPHQEMYSYYRKASFLVHAITKPESNPLVVMEALASGTHVLGTKISPLPEMLKSDNGTCLLSSDQKDLVEAVKHPERFDRHACRSYAEKHFDIEVIAKKHKDLYEKIISRSV